MARSHYDLEDELRQKNRELRDLRELREQIRKMSEEERHLLREIENLTTGGRRRKRWRPAGCCSPSRDSPASRWEGPGESHDVRRRPPVGDARDRGRVRASHHGPVGYREGESGAVMHRYSLEQRVPWAVRKAFFRYAKDMLANILPRLMWKAMAEGNKQ